MTEENRGAFQSNEQWFKNYIEHGGPPPTVTPENHLGARRALEAALTGHKSLPSNRLNLFERMVGLAKSRIRTETFTPIRPQVLKELTNYPDWFLRTKAVGAGLDGVMDPNQALMALTVLLQEAASLSMMRARRG